MPQENQQLEPLSQLFPEGLSSNSDTDDRCLPLCKTQCRHRSPLSRSSSSVPKINFTKFAADRQITAKQTFSPLILRFDQKGRLDSPERSSRSNCHFKVGGCRRNRLLPWRRFVHSGATRVVNPAQIDFEIGVGRSLDRGPGQALTGAATAAPGGALRPLFSDSAHL